VVVAVIVVWVMDVALHEKIDVTRVWHGLVPASRIVTVGWIVCVTIVPTRTVRWIRAGSAQLMFVNVPLVHVMQMPVVQIVSVIVVLRFGVPAGTAVSMVVRVVRCMCRHRGPPNLRFGIKYRDTGLLTLSLEYGLLSRSQAYIRLPRTPPRPVRFRGYSRGTSDGRAPPASAYGRTLTPKLNVRGGA
jgi:hypothetical protein